MNTACIIHAEYVTGFELYDVDAAAAYPFTLTEETRKKKQRAKDRPVVPDRYVQLLLIALTSETSMVIALNGSVSMIIVDACYSAKVQTCKVIITHPKWQKLNAV